MGWIEELSPEQRATLLQTRLQAAMLLPEGEREPHLRELLSQSSNGAAPRSAERPGKMPVPPRPERRSKLTVAQYEEMRAEAESLFGRGFTIDEAYGRIMAVPGRQGFARKSLYRWFRDWERRVPKLPQGEMFPTAEVMALPEDARD